MPTPDIKKEESEKVFKKFYPPVLTYPHQCESVLVRPGGDFLVQEPMDKKLLNDPTEPILFIAENVLKEVMYITDKQTGEWAGYMPIMRLNNMRPHFLAYGLFLTEQEVSAAYVEADGEDSCRYFKYLKETYPEQFKEGMHSKLAHIHSHVNMGVTRSSTDERQRLDRGQLGFQGDYRFYLIINKNEDLDVTFVQYNPVFLEKQGILAGLYVNKEVPPEMSKERKADLDEQMEELISKRYEATYEIEGYAEGAPTWLIRWIHSQMLDALAPFAMQMEPETESALMKHLAIKNPEVFATTRIKELARIFKALLMELPEGKRGTALSEVADDWVAAIYLTAEGLGFEEYFEPSENLCHLIKQVMKVGGTLFPASEIKGKTLPEVRETINLFSRGDMNV